MSDTNEQQDKEKIDASRKRRQRWAKQLEVISQALANEAAMEAMDEERREHSIRTNMCLCFAASVLGFIAQNSIDDASRKTADYCLAEIRAVMSGESDRPPVWTDPAQLQNLNSTTKGQA